jgi:hypothetical protein
MPYHVGEVLLALRVVRPDRASDLAQDGEVERIQAGVHLGDLELLGGGVLCSTIAVTPPSGPAGRDRSRWGRRGLP